MPEFENGPEPMDQEQNEKAPAFETTRKIAAAELGPLNSLSYEEALLKMREIAEQKGIANPTLVVAIQGFAKREFTLNQDEAETQWSVLADEYKDDEMLPMPIAFVVDEDKYHY